MIQNNSNGHILVKILLIIAVISGLSIGAYTYLQKVEIEQKNSASFIYIDKAFENIVNTLASTDDCLASLQGKNAITDKSITRIQKSGKEIFSANTPLEGSNLRLVSYSLESSASDVKNNLAQLTIHFEEIKKRSEPSSFTKTAALYVEVDDNDNITFCHTLSSSILKKDEAPSRVRLRVTHVASLGVEAKADGVRTSIAVATCPKDTLMTGCSGSVNGCNAVGESLRKIEPQALNPNTCEVWADATATCPVTAKALAICTRIIQK